MITVRQRKRDGFSLQSYTTESEERQDGRDHTKDDDNSTHRVDVQRCI